jgi:hypothetical protein
MPRGPCNFRQRDLEAAIRALVKMGVPRDNLRVEFGKDGKPIVSSSPPIQPAQPSGKASAWLPKQKPSRGA